MIGIVALVLRFDNRCRTTESVLNIALFEPVCGDRNAEVAGGSSEGAYTGLLPGRRLWNSGVLVGVTGELTASNKNQSEIFSKLQQFGPYKIPGEIEFNEGDHHELFVIRRVEFLPQPNEEWFDLVREKYFGDRRAINLGEPVW